MKQMISLVVILLLILSATFVQAQDEQNKLDPKDQALLNAARYGRVKTVKELLSKGADVNVKDERGYTPLHYAVQEGRKKIVELLIAKGANVNAKGKFDKTPLHVATLRVRNDIIKLLVAKGADVNAKDNNGYPPLYSANRIGHIETIALLIALGADINAKGRNGMSSLHNIAWQGKKQVVELLITLGADVNVKTNHGETPLHWAISPPKHLDWEDHKGIVELLIAKGADINAKDRNGLTPLHKAVHEGRQKSVELLLVQGARVNAISGYFKTPLDGAKTEEMKVILIKHGATSIPEKGDKAPLMDFTYLDGTHDSLANHRGQIVVIDFWATWYRSSPMYMGYVQRIWTKYKDDGVYVVGISKEKSANVAIFLSNKPEFSYPIGIFPRYSTVYGVRSLPQAYIIDQFGVVWWHGSPAKVDKPLKELLRKSPALVKANTVAILKEAIVNLADDKTFDKGYSQLRDLMDNFADVEPTVSEVKKVLLQIEQKHGDKIAHYKKTLTHLTDTFASIQQAIKKGGSLMPRQKGQELIAQLLKLSQSGKDFPVHDDIVSELESLKRSFDGNGYLGVMVNMIFQGPGARLSSVKHGGAAAHAQLMAGDVVLKMDGIIIKNGDGFFNVIGKSKPGQTMVFTILRDGKNIVVTIILGRKVY